MSIAGGVGAAVRLPTPDARYGVEVSAARSSGRQSFRNGLRRSTALTDVATVTRATAAWGVDQGGNVSSFAAGQPVVTTAGLAVYEARTNSIRNPTFLGSGGAKGGSGATILGNVPDNMYIDGTSGITISVIGAGAEGNQPYLEVDVSGTPAASPHFAIQFDSTAVAASNGQVWTPQAGARLISGSMANVTAVTQRINQLSTSDVVLGTKISANFKAQLNTAARYDAHEAMTLDAGASVAKVISFVAFSGLGAAVAYRVRIYAPNLKLGADINDPPILQTNNAAATRNADMITEAVNIPVGQSFTVTGKVIAPASQTYNQFVFVLDDGQSTPTNLLRVNFNAGALLAKLVAGGIETSNISLGTIAAGAPVGIALSVEGSTVAFSVNGVEVATQTMAGPFAAALTRLCLGHYPGGSNQLNSTLRDLAITMRAYSAAERAIASDVTLTHDVDFVSQVYQYVGAPYVTPTDLPGTTFSRASEALNADAAGQWYAFASGTLRVTSAGCFFGESTTNKCTNYNAKPTDLTGVSRFGDAASTLTRVDATTELRAAGYGPLIDAGKMNGFVYKLDNSAGATSAGANIGGAVGNTNTHTVSAVGWTTSGSGAYISFDGASGAQTFPPTTPTRTSRGGTPASSSTNAYIIAPAGCVVLFILNQLEEKANMTSPVIVSGASATRNADVLASANDNNPTAYTVVAEFTIPLTGPPFGRVWGYDDGTTSNRVMLLFDRAAGKLTAQVDTGGVTQAGLDLGSVTPGQTYKVAFAVAANDFAAIRTGGTLATDTSGTVPSTNQFGCGCSPASGNQFGGLVRRIQRYAGRKTNSELQALVA